MRAGSICPSEGKRIAGSLKPFMLLGKPGIGAVHSDIVCKTSGYALGIGEESDARRLTYGLEDIFLIAITLFFVSMVLSCGRKEGICVEEGGPA